jgi:phage/plasmid-like protein (TIGR03299 family)
MAHELDMTTGSAAIAYAKAEGTPWHGLGASVEGVQSIEEWRKAARMEFDYLDSPVYMTTNGGQSFEESELSRKVIYRSDTKKALSVVGGDYAIVQPAEILEFFRDLTETGGFQMSTVGALFGGRKIWALAKIGKDAAIQKTDRIGGYLMLATSCDGSMATTGMFTSVQVVCNNTLRYATLKDGESADTIRIPHSTKFDSNKVKRDLGLAEASWDCFIEEVNALSKKKISRATAVQMLRAGFADNDEDESVLEMDADKFIALPKPAQIMTLWEGGGIGSALKSQAGTAWGLVSAVTEFVDHGRGARRSQKADNRIDSAFFGDGNEFKQDLVWRIKGMCGIGEAAAAMSE